MQAVAVNELWTLLVALLTIQLGIVILGRVPVLARYSIPPRWSAASSSRWC